jgi:hypothetical protein
MSLTDFLTSIQENSKASKEFAEFSEILEQFNAPEEIYTESYVANS